MKYLLVIILILLFSCKSNEYSLTKEKKVAINLVGRSLEKGRDGTFYFRRFCDTSIQTFRIVQFEGNMDSIYTLQEVSYEKHNTPNNPLPRLFNEQDVANEVNIVLALMSKYDMKNVNSEYFWTGILLDIKLNSGQQLIYAPTIDEVVNIEWKSYLEEIESLGDGWYLNRDYQNHQ